MRPVRRSGSRRWGQYVSPSGPPMTYLPLLDRDLNATTSLLGYAQLPGVIDDNGRSKLTALFHLAPRDLALKLR